MKRKTSLLANNYEYKRYLTTFAADIGELAEWLKALAWKACIPQKGIKGSNPLLSANDFYMRSLIWHRIV